MNRELWSTGVLVATRVIGPLPFLKVDESDELDMGDVSETSTASSFAGKLRTDLALLARTDAAGEASSWLRL